MSPDPPDLQRNPSGHVFLSYCREDSEAARRIFEALEARGVTVWWDRNLKGGEAFAQRIELAIRSSYKVVVLWSAVSVHSDWVRDEAALARDLGLLAPVSLDKTPPPLGFGQYHTVDMSGWSGAADSPQIEDLVAVTAQNAAAPAVRRAKKTALAPRAGGALVGRRGLILGAGAGAAAIGAGYLAAARFGWLSASPGASSVAVLPFENLSGDASVDYICEGLGEELISALARLGSLQVAGKISSYRFRKSDKPPSVIGASLGVAYLIDGSLRRMGEVFRINVHLTEARTGFSRWSQFMDAPADDVLGLETRLSETVAEQLRGHIGDGDKAQLASGRADNPAAFDAYLKGRRLFEQGGTEAVYREALTSFEAAILAEPKFALARAFKARVLLTLADEFMGKADHQRAYDAALASVREAAALAPDQPEVQATLADVIATTKLDLGAAARAYGVAMKTGAGAADVLTRFGLFAARTGDVPGGVSAAKYAAVLDPLNPSVFKSLGMVLTLAGDRPGAEKALSQALVLNPAFAGVHYRLGDLRYLAGDFEAARKEYGLETTQWLRLTGLAMVLAKTNDPIGADAALKTLRALPDAVTLYQEAQIYAQTGRIDEAFATLDQADRARDSGLVALKTDPMLEPIKKDPRFAKVLGEMGLTADI